MKQEQPILIATDGTPASMSAVRAGSALAVARGQPLIVLAVAEPTILPGEGFAYPMVLVRPDLDRENAERLHSVVEAQIAEVAEAPLDLRIEVRLGAPAQTVVRAAVDHEAGMIVVGLGRHDARERWLGTETALKITHLAHVPVLAVHPEADGLPSRTLVAVDFSDFSRDAARSAVHVMPLGGELHLAHVCWTLPAGVEASRETAWIETYRVGARVRLDEMQRDLRTCDRLRCVSTVLEGEAARALIKYARMSGADLIASGSHGYGFLGRMMMGSVSTRLIRQAPCSVLVAPPRAVAPETLAERAPEVSKLEAAGVG